MKEVKVFYRHNLLLPEPSERRKEAENISDEEAEQMTELYEEIGHGQKEIVEIKEERLEEEWVQPLPEKKFEDEDDSTLLSAIWRMFNDYSKNPLSAQNQPGEDDSQPALEDNNIKHTSISVGDIVKIEDTTYIACGHGWAEVEVTQ